MSTAQLFVDAIHTADTAFRWAVGWLITLATVGSILIVAAVACGVWGVGAARGRLERPESAETAVPVPESPRTAKRRPVPSWAHTEPYDYDQTA